MSNPDEKKRLRVDSIQAWREWLQNHHNSVEVIWLVFKKKTTGPVPFDYQMALDEALCFGWVDSLLRRIDDSEYMRKFTPRKPTSTWSEINKRKVGELIRTGRMTPHGMKVVEAAKKNGRWDKGVTPPEVNDGIPGALLRALEQNPRARNNYFGMKERCRKQYNIWINMAKRPETIRKRLEESIRLLEDGRELGLK